MSEIKVGCCFVLVIDIIDIVSGEATRDAVVCVKDGLIYERALIHQLIQDQGRTPAGVEVSVNDLITMSSPVVTARAPSLTSIPATLMSLQNEWDVLMLSTYELKKKYSECQTMLSNALYENDAAKRVVARLIKERDEARKMLSEYSGSNQAAHVQTQEKIAEVTMDVDEILLPDTLITTIDTLAEQLTTERRKRKAPESLISAEEIGSLTVKQEIKTLGTAKEPGTNSLDLLDTEEHDWILAGGVDGAITVVDLKAAKSVCSTKTHKKQVISALWTSNSTFISTSLDSTVRLFSVEEQKNGYKLKVQETMEADMKCIAVHPSKSIFAAGGQDVWTLNDLETFQPLVTVSARSLYSCLSFHPDGLILGAGSSQGQVVIYDVKTNKIATEFKGHNSEISSVAFSENGYHLATSSLNDHFVKFWDLRKLTEFQSLQFEHGVQKVKFDHSGKYVGVATGNTVL